MFTNSNHRRDSTTSTRASTDVDTDTESTTETYVELNQYGFSWHENPDTGEETVHYQVRDLDLRARRIDSTAITLSFGIAGDIIQYKEACLMFGDER